ncbi:MAG: hypothetical protein ACE5J7_03030 [Candidatus Aenigmatarchaeota archaeon]
MTKENTTYGRTVRRPIPDYADPDVEEVDVKAIVGKPKPKSSYSAPAQGDLGQYISNIEKVLDALEQTETMLGRYPEDFPRITKAKAEEILKRDEWKGIMKDYREIELLEASIDEHVSRGDDYRMLAKAPIIDTRIGLDYNPSTNAINLSNLVVQTRTIPRGIDTFMRIFLKQAKKNKKATVSLRYGKKTEQREKEVPGRFWGTKKVKEYVQVVDKGKIEGIVVQYDDAEIDVKFEEKHGDKKVSFRGSISEPNKDENITQLYKWLFRFDKTTYEDMVKNIHDIYEKGTKLEEKLHKDKNYKSVLKLIKDNIPEDKIPDVIEKRNKIIGNKGRLEENLEGLYIPCGDIVATNISVDNYGTIKISAKGNCKNISANKYVDVLEALMEKYAIEGEIHTEKDKDSVYYKIFTEIKDDQMKTKKGPVYSYSGYNYMDSSESDYSRDKDNEIKYLNVRKAEIKFQTEDVNSKGEIKYENGKFSFFIRTNPEHIDDFKDILHTPVK